MTMLNAGHMEASMAPKNAMRIDPDADGDNDAQVTCPECGAQFAPEDTDNDAMQMAQGQPGAAPGQPPPPPAQEDMQESSCPECGAKMEGGKCAACGYSATHSPMTDAASRYLSTRPKEQRPPVKDVVDQGMRARQHMRRPAPYGRP